MNLRQIYHQLIVSCQALPDEPLHSSFIMGRMALAAYQGGAGGIRANTTEDIIEIRKNVHLPIIGIIKRDYQDSKIYITPSMNEVDELENVHPEIIAIDATDRRRPGGQDLEQFIKSCKRKYPDQIWMADCSTKEEMIRADRLGFDLIGTTLVGYTDESKGMYIEEDDFGFIRQVLHEVHHPVIAEGRIDTPEKAARVIELGCWSVVVGSAITRPQLITRKFSSKISGK